MAPPFLSTMDGSNNLVSTFIRLMCFLSTENVIIIRFIILERFLHSCGFPPHRLHDPTVVHDPLKVRKTFFQNLIHLSRSKVIVLALFTILLRTRSQLSYFHNIYITTQQKFVAYYHFVLPDDISFI